MSDFSEPRKDLITYVAEGATQLAVNLTINGAKADKNGHYIMFSTQEGYLIETEILPETKKFEMALHRPPYGQFLAAYFSDWMIAATSVDNSNDQILDVYLKYVNRG
jgi:hypothetical protein